MSNVSSLVQNAIPRSWRYLKYLLLSKGKHGIHSPFVFDLLTNTIENDGEYYAFEDLERLRNRLLNNHDIINVTDFGAGSSTRSSGFVIPTYKRKISDIAQHSLQSPKYAKLLFRLVDRFQPKQMLELGTSLGLTTLYQAAPVPHSKFITLEGCPVTASIAQEHFNKFKQDKIKLVTGNFDETLPEALKSLDHLDYVLFDGNHRYEPTLNYFNLCLKNAHEGSVFIFDDIHWSNEMEQAWEEIKNHPKVIVTLDLFKIGIVFFHTGQVKQHFRIRY
jgi:predicted O-methyltransferase YrrM